jgi:hypothetical protein
MSDSNPDIGVLQAVLDRLNNQRLPRLLGLQEKVDRGERLSDQDLAFLNEALPNAQDLKGYVDRNPDAQSVYARVVGLYKAITEKALGNEGDA